MDTNYKLADHKPVDPLTLKTATGRDWYNTAEHVRSYVGPKGWIIKRNPSNQLWIMTHESYPDLSLTMLDIDGLPVGRHNWKINNNVCNQGTTNVQSLLISACKEEEFTCDDGKCLDISQRCNNIEVIGEKY